MTTTAHPPVADMVRLTEAARIVGVAPSRIIRLVQEGRVARTVGPDGAYRYSRQDAEAELAKRVARRPIRPLAHPHITPEDLIALGEAAQILGQRAEWISNLGQQGVLTRYSTPLGYLYSRREVEARRDAKVARREARLARKRVRKAANLARRQGVIASQ